MNVDDYERHASGRLFKSAFMERASQVHPATPFVVYIPLVLVLMGYGFWRHLTSLGPATVGFVAGWLIWQWMEYVIHRGFFHWEGNGPLTRRIHEIAHGYHHRYPDDTKRLVMPVGGSAPLAIVIALILHAVGHVPVTLPLYCGIVCGYLWYDFIHWSTHARPPLTAWGKAQRAHHMSHHFADNTTNFGISYQWIDVLMGTRRDRTPGRDRATSPQGAN
jgi:sterol desaturase/sphingolipid hydroxylase (fatty acid hydroxylase superfamily)